MISYAGDAAEPLERFDPETQKRLEELAANLVTELLKRRVMEHPRHPQKVHYPEGTTRFMVLQRLVTDPNTLVFLLDRAAHRLTANEARRTRISLADPAVCTKFGAGTTEIFMYPHGLNVENLRRVPDDLRIFRLYGQEEAYEVTEIVPYGPEQIARERAFQADTVETRRKAWRSELSAQHEALVARVRAEFERQQSTLDPDVREAIKDLLSKGASYPSRLLELLQAASYLGIFIEVTAGFAEQSE